MNFVPADADGTCISMLIKSARKVNAQNSKNQVGSVSSGQRGTLTTKVCCVSASGNYVPSNMIFKCSRGKGAIFAFTSKSVYITFALFLV